MSENGLKALVPSFRKREMLYCGLVDGNGEELEFADYRRREVSVSLDTMFRAQFESFDFNWGTVAGLVLCKYPEPRPDSGLYLARIWFDTPEEVGKGEEFFISCRLNRLQMEILVRIVEPAQLIGAREEDFKNV